MTEEDWLKGKNSDAMLRLISSRMTPRRWQLLCCAVVRRAADSFADVRFREAIDWVERNAGTTVAEQPKILEHLRSIRHEAIQKAREAQRQIVCSVDPDADPNEFRVTAEGRTNPSAPLFRSACEMGAAAIKLAEEAAEHAVAAVMALVSDTANADLLTRVRESIVEATRLQACASLQASTALDLKARGDEAADRNSGKNARIQLAVAEGMVTRAEEHLGYRISDIAVAKQRADRKAIARFLHDLIGNPFRPYRFESRWRTSTVLGLARGIYEDRAFDRMPILADALLDADCDEEAILRHCRGQELHALDGLTHIRGCWVIDLILNHESAPFAAPPLTVTSPPPASHAVSRRRPDPAIQRLLEAINRGELPEDHDD